MLRPPPIILKVGYKIDRRTAPIRVSKALIQSTQLKKSVGMVYEVSLTEETNGDSQYGTDTEERALNIRRKIITTPVLQSERSNYHLCIVQIERKWRCSGAHINKELRDYGKVKNPCKIA